ncbi:hypothetical protein E2542_SST14249 [Spatholobus suberectus]|nr:hypothetical protein E2542_SST14249 [Spatholobus suberectus]
MDKEYKGCEIYREGKKNVESTKNKGKQKKQSATGQMEGSDTRSIQFVSSSSSKPGDSLSISSTWTLESSSFAQVV